MWKFVAGVLFSGIFLRSIYADDPVSCGIYKKFEDRAGLIKFMNVTYCAFNKQTHDSLFTELEKISNDTSYLQIRYQKQSTNITTLTGKLLQRPAVRLLEYYATDFTQFDNSTFNFPNKLEALVIANCGIEKLKAKLFVNLKQLRILKFRNQGIVHVEEDSFIGLKNLEAFELISADVRDLYENTFNDLELLRSIDLRNNLVKYLHSNLFATLKNLEYLNIQKNKIEILDENLFRNNLKLKQILLADNNIIVILKNDFKTFSKLTVLDLTDNECVDHNFKFEEVEVAHNSISLIDAILFPLCNKDYGLKPKSSLSTIVLLKATTIGIVIIVLVLLMICCKRMISSPVSALNEREVSDHGFKNLISQFFNESSIHGIRYIGHKRNHILEKTFWSVAFTISFILSMTLIYQTFVKWQGSPVLIGFEKTSSRIHDVPFPAITICSQHKLVFIENPEVLEKRLTDLLVIATEAHMQICPVIKKAHQRFVPTYEQSSNNSKLYNSAVHFWNRDVYSKITFKWNNQESIYYSHTLTNEGSCVTFNMINGREIIKDNLEMQWYSFPIGATWHAHTSKSWNVESGYSSNARYRVFPLRMSRADSKAGLLVNYGIQILKTDILCEDNPHEFKVIVHQPADWPSTAERSFKFPFNTRATMIIKPKITKTDHSLRFYKPETRQCFFQDENFLQFFKIYSKSNCELECRTNFTLRACNCAAFYMPRTNDTRICNYYDINCMNIVNKNSIISLSQCNCLPACYAVEYDVILSQSPEETDQKLKSQGIIRSIFHAYIEDGELIALERSEIFGLTDLIGNCGGLLGLFMGVSVLSIIELFYYFTVKLALRKLF